MPTVACTVCAAPFYAKPSHIKKGWGKYCSKKCQYKSQSTGSTVCCYTCERLVYRAAGESKRSKSGRYFCSKSCQTIWRNSQYIEAKHSNWTTGQSSYRAILKRSGKPLICKKCQTSDERVLAVHHRDKNRSNNTVANLVWLCHNCHHLVHNHPLEAGDLLVDNPVIFRENAV